MQFIPNDVRFAVSKFENFNSNCFRLETSGATSAGPSSIITLTLPSNCVIDLRSFKVHMDIATTSAAAVTNVNGLIYAKLPADTSSLIQQCEVYCGGVQISQGFSEFNTVSKVKKLIFTSRDRDSSVNNTLSHGTISGTDAVDNISCIFKPNIGFFAESSTRYLPTSITGDISVRITLASTAVLTFKESGQNIGVNFVQSGTAASNVGARAAAATLTYSVSSIHATCQTVTLGDQYESMLLDRLTQEEFLSVYFKEYYTFALHGTAGTSHDVRFSLSASSIDRLYAVCRDSNYQTPGIRARVYKDSVSLSDANCANHFFFKSFNPTALHTRRGDVRYQYSVNNVQHPQYQADGLDACHELVMISDSHSLAGRGNMITGLGDWNDGKAVFPLQLCMPGQPINVRVGYNSRGNNTQFSISITNQTMETVNAAAQVTASISTLVIAETSSEMRISGGRQVAIAT